LVRLLFVLIILFAVFLGTHSTKANLRVFQDPPKPQNQTEQSQKEQNAKEQVKASKDQKNPTAEQIAESAIFIYGSRPVLEQIRRNGVERGRITRIASDGKTEESSYERHFVRGENFEKDKIRIDQKLPSVEYSLIYGAGKLWGLINGAAFTPRQDAISGFLSQHQHSVDSLLRYKENGSTLTLVGKDKQKGLDLFIVDLLDKENHKTRYYISAKTLYVRWLEYEEAPAPGAQPVKYTRKFYDYRYAQQTLVPYRSELFEDGIQTQEIRILNVTFGVKVDDSLFKNPDDVT
jgi:outer membrane lipoprotein-sorting protein